MGNNLTLARVYISCLLVALLAISGTRDQRKMMRPVRGLEGQIYSKYYTSEIYICGIIDDQKGTQLFINS